MGTAGPHSRRLRFPTARSPFPFPWLSATGLLSRMISTDRAFPNAWANAFDDFSWSVFRNTIQHPRSSKSFGAMVAAQVQLPFFRHWGCPPALHRQHWASQCHVLLHCSLVQDKESVVPCGPLGICFKEIYFMFLCGCDLPRRRTYAEHQSLFGRCNSSCASIIACVG